MGLLVGCFVAEFTELAFHHDKGDMDVSSSDVLRRLALQWETEGDED